MTPSERILSAIKKAGLFLLTSIARLVFGVLLFRRPLKRVVNALLVVLTCLFILIFLVGESSLPGPDTLFRALWVFLLLGLEEFLRASWKPPSRFVTAIIAGKWWFIFLAGVFFVLTGLVGAFLTAFEFNASPDIAIFLSVVVALLLIQGARMLWWAWNHTPGNASSEQ